VTGAAAPSAVPRAQDRRKATASISATLPVGASPTDVAISPDGHSAYVADRDSGTVAVIHTG
jgi:DNA-binding beta-propeller fold protein YncE